MKSKITTWEEYKNQVLETDPSAAKDMDEACRAASSVINALHHFQQEMEGAAENAGLVADEAVDEWITASRRKEIEK